MLTSVWAGATSTAVSSAMRRTALPIISSIMSITSRGQIYGESTTTQSASRTTKGGTRGTARSGVEAGCDQLQRLADRPRSGLLQPDVRFRPFYENIKTVFTIHNIQYQGRYGREILEYVLGIDDAHFRSGFMAMDGDVNLMKAAIVASTAVTTVSPTYANEIQTEYYGYRLDSVLRMNSLQAARHPERHQHGLRSIRRPTARSSRTTARTTRRISWSTRPSF